MKIALIGNMNNNFFSIMRYFRDLDIDAHLFMYRGEYEHFKPEKDTYNIENYREYIHTLSIKPSVKGLLFVDKNRIKRELEGYDFFIGCDIAPALFYKLGMRLDILIPYHDNIEHTSQPKLIHGARREIIKRFVQRYVINLQIKGVKENTTKIILDTIQDIGKKAIKRLELSDKLIKKYIPMVYLEEAQKNSDLNEIIELMNRQDLVVFCHTRHSWGKKSIREDYDGKGLDQLIIGYSQFIRKAHSNIKPLLIFFEYGEEVEESKQLIKKLGIESYIEWLPIMARKDILQLIDHADIVVDSLSVGMWGGVGWEGLSRGKILIQDIEQTDEEYRLEMGHEFPFVMRAKNANDIERHLNSFIQDREYYSQKAKYNKEWFDKYAGIGLAKEYKEIVQELYSKKLKETTHE
jgi:hypothetical protein